MGTEQRIETYDPPADNLRIEISVAEIRGGDFVAFQSEIWAVIRRYSQWGTSFSVGAPRPRGRLTSNAGD
jgi:hypothetical protein